MNTDGQLLVSVITPVRNGAKYLELCIQSVLNQKYHNIEHIVVDGASTDGTVDILAKYHEQIPNRLRYISEPDKNQGDAWIKGLNMARGAIIGWIGSDDTYEPDAVQTVVKFFETNQDAKFVFGGCNYIDDKGEILKKVITKNFILEEAINDVCYIPWPSVFCKPEVIKQVNVRVVEELNSDQALWIEVGKVFSIHRIEQTLSNFRIHKGQARGESDLYSYARTRYILGRRHGASIFAPCSRRYYLVLMTRPFHPILSPIFHFMSSGDVDKSGFLIKLTKPFHSTIALVYRLVIGSKSTN